MLFEELDFQQTPQGELSLRRRADPRLDGQIVYEVKLGDEFLMSSLFVEAEVQLAELAITKLDRSDIDVVVGGLGLGYTAYAALQSDRVSRLSVIEVMQPVIDWHRRHLVPLGRAICDDARCRLIQGDFFLHASQPGYGFDPNDRDIHVDAVLLDIDHSPRHWLHPSNAMFYSEQGLRGLADKIKPAGVFGLWSNDPPDNAFCALLEIVFTTVETHIVRFENPYTGGQSSNTVYLALK